MRWMVAMLALGLPGLLPATEAPYLKRETREATWQASTQAIAQAFAAVAPKQGPWRFIGPFDNAGRRGETTAYPPEYDLDSQAEYEGRGGQRVRWQDGSRFADGRPGNLLDLAPASDFAIYYLHRTIEADQEASAVMFFGSDDALDVWLNGEKIHEYHGERAVKVDEDRVSVRLKAGVNHLLLKVANRRGGFGFAYRLSGLTPRQEAQMKAWLDQAAERLEADFPGKEAAFYKLETVPLPTGVVLEPGGLAFLPDGRLAVSTRRGEIWLANLASNQWARFASGLHEALGLWPEGTNQVVVAQRPELTRVTDTDGDGQADLFETLTDAFGVSGNYHEFHYGPVKDRNGNFYGTLNVGWEDSGVSRVPYRGWAYQLTPRGEFIPYALGLRSPCGLGISPAGDIFITDNQGDWWATSPLLHLKAGAFYGHAASLKWERDYAGPADPRTLPPDQLEPRRQLPAAWFVYGKLGSSPGEPVWDTTGGKFGPFAGQMFVGDQTKSFLLRAALEKVGGEYQGAIFPFRAGFASGLLRGAFAPDGSLYVGQTDRGWGSVGGKPFALQRVTWTGRVPLEIHSMKLTPDGFDLTFTKPIDPTAARDPAAYSFQHYHYHYWRTYGSPLRDVTPVKVREARVSTDGRTVSLVLPDLREGRVYELHVAGLKGADGSDLEHPEAYYTLNRLRAKPDVDAAGR